MSEPLTADRVEELGAIFVSLTGEDSVTEHQQVDSSDRELDEDGAVDVDDGLHDAVAGAETRAGSDPVE